MSAKNSKKTFTRNLNNSLAHFSPEAFDSWAANYDDEVASVNYEAPRRAVKAALKVCDDGKWLDLGCGTGLVGQELKKIKGEYKIFLEGCDFSEEMLKIAKEKKVYSKLEKCDIYKLPFKEKSYDLVIAVGVFGAKVPNKPAYDALPRVTAILKPKGHLVFSVSLKNWSTDGRDYQNVITSMPVRIVEVREEKYHDVLGNMKLIILQNA